MHKNPRKRTIGKTRTRQSGRHRYNSIKTKRHNTPEDKISKLDDIDIKAPHPPKVVTGLACHVPTVDRVHHTLLLLKSETGWARIGTTCRQKQKMRHVYKRTIKCPKLSLMKNRLQTWTKLTLASCKFPKTVRGNDQWKWPTL